MFSNFLFLLSAVLTIGGAMLVVSSQNLMHACIYLLASFFGVAGLYACIDADFLAATQLVVYAGGVVILMLFAVMLTGGTGNKVNRYGLNKIPSMGNLKTYVMASLTGVVASLTLLRILIPVFRSTDSVAVLGAGVVSSVEKLGVLLATDHILAFEISSVLLLGALVGAAVISRPRREIND